MTAELMVLSAGAGILRVVQSPSERETCSNTSPGFWMASSAVVKDVFTSVQPGECKVNASSGNEVESECDYSA